MSDGNLCLSCGQRNVILTRSGEKEKDQYLKYKCPDCEKEGKILIKKNESKKRNTIIYKEFIQQQIQLKNALAQTISSAIATTDGTPLFTVTCNLHSNVPVQIAGENVYEYKKIEINKFVKDVTLNITFASEGIGHATDVEGYNFSNFGPGTQRDLKKTKTIIRSKTRNPNVCRTYNSTNETFPLINLQGGEAFKGDTNGIYLYFLTDTPIYSALTAFFETVKTEDDENYMFFETVKDFYDSIHNNISGASLHNPQMKAFISFMINRKLEREPAESALRILNLISQDFRQKKEIKFIVILTFLNILKDLSYLYCRESELLIEKSKPVSLLLTSCLHYIYENNKEIDPNSIINNPATVTAPDNKLWSTLPTPDGSRVPSRNPSTVPPPPAGGGSALGTIYESSSNSSAAGGEGYENEGGSKRTKRRKRGKRRKTLRKKF
jgi:hypothetical protein